MAARFYSGIRIQKSKKNEEEYNSFAFATNCLLAFYGSDDFIKQDEYEKILSCLEKGGAVIITIVEERYSRNVYPEVLVSNNNKLKWVGKVISICKDNNENVDLLRKTSLSVWSEDVLNEMFSDKKTDEMEQVNLPSLIKKQNVRP